MKISNKSLEDIAKVMWDVGKLCLSSGVVIPFIKEDTAETLTISSIGFAILAFSAGITLNELMERRNK